MQTITLNRLHWEQLRNRLRNKTTQWSRVIAEGIDRKLSETSENAFSMTMCDGPAWEINNEVPFITSLGDLGPERLEPRTHTRGDMLCSALISPDGLYRYWLMRVWDLDNAGNLLVFVGLNPSTADHEQDDPTIRRCIGFAKKHGYAGILMMNVYALRSTDPAALRKSNDPIGPENVRYFRKMLQVYCACRWVAAWGAHREASKAASKMFYDIACDFDLPTFYSLGVTRGGQPKHPLYLAADTPFEYFDPLIPT